EPADADEAHRVAQHGAAGVLQGGSDRGTVVDRSGERDGIVHEAARGEGTAREARALERGRRAEDRRLQDRIADDVVAPAPADDEEVVAVELETKLAREVGQPEEVPLESDGNVLVHERVERLAGARPAEEATGPVADPEAPTGLAEDRQRIDAIGRQGDAHDLEKGRVEEENTAADPEDHRLVDREAAVREERRSDPALAVSCVKVS